MDKSKLNVDYSRCVSAIQWLRQESQISLTYILTELYRRKTPTDLIENSGQDFQNRLCDVPVNTFLLFYRTPAATPTLFLPNMATCCRPYGYACLFPGAIAYGRTLISMIPTYTHLLAACGFVRLLKNDMRSLAIYRVDFEGRVISGMRRMDGSD